MQILNQTLRGVEKYVNVIKHLFDKYTLKITTHNMQILNVF